MRKRSDIWTWAGFFTGAVLGTLGHFAYDWSGKSLPVGAFCAVNESTWEHMKLLFFPVLLFTAVQLCLRWESGLLAARAVSTTAGLVAIPALFYTYSGVLGRTVDWVNILIFYVADAALFGLDSRLRRCGHFRAPWLQTAGALWLWLLAFLFVWWTFPPPYKGLFLHPVTGQYGIA